jgi:iron complex transport system substrate-binding protein
VANAARRIVSFLPAATEMACALGLEAQLVGVSHECDFPAAARTKPTVVRPALDLASLAPSDIDVTVSSHLRVSESLYAVDESLVRSLDPDLILTQDLCQVCAPSGNDVTRLIGSLAHSPDVMYFTPRELADVWRDLQALGDASGTRDIADAIVADAERRIEAIAQLVARAERRPRVVFAEWVDPIYCAGHWVPEMIALAGGVDPLARPGGESVRVPWDDVVASSPDVVVIAPCGFGVAAAMEQLPLLTDRAGWASLPAVRHGQVFVVDANAYFARPGPRLVDGIELLAHIFHPGLVDWSGALDAFHPVAQAATS